MPSEAACDSGTVDRCDRARARDDDGDDDGADDDDDDDDNIRSQGKQGQSTRSSIAHDCVSTPIPSMSCSALLCSVVMQPRPAPMVGISIEVEREMRIRRRLRGIFNERREDFPTLKEFNDYLE